MPTYRTAQTYDVYSKNKKQFYGRFTSLVDARKKAMQMTSRQFGGDYHDTIIIKNPKMREDGSIRPAITLVIITCEMFIRPKYDYKYFGKEMILKNDEPTGLYKYYLLDKKGNIDITDRSFDWYFDHTHPSVGVWSRPRK